MIQIDFARRIPRNAPRSESMLWLRMRANGLCGARFRRRQPIGPYIVDFVCFERRLIVELDGGESREHKHFDETRNQWLASNGYKVLRFWDCEVEADLASVLTIIEHALTPDLPMRAAM